jgi:hypothetical protein
MLFIYLPNILLLLAWIYYVEFNVFLSILLTPLSYIAINGALIYYKQFNLVHLILDKTIILTIAENQLKNIVLFIIGLIFRISYVNKCYSWLKVKILLYIFNVIVSYIPDQKNNELTNDLKNDYLEILNRNRKKSAITMD